MTERTACKWVDITDKIEKLRLTTPLTGVLHSAIQFRDGDMLVCTLARRIDGKERLILSDYVQRGLYRVTVDYAADPDYGVGSIYKRVISSEWIDVTSECEVKIRKSHGSSGYYILLHHNDTPLVLFGLKGSLKPYKVPEGYRVKMAENATVSFNVFKKTRN